MRRVLGILATVGLVVLAGCSTKKNTFFNRQYHRMTTRYNVYFNGNEALKNGLKKMDQNHKEDYTNLLPVFVSNNDQTRAVATADMDYAVEKAAKAIDKHSITAKPKRRKNKDSKSYETFRKKKEFNDQIARCYLLMGKAYFYKKKYTMAGNTFRYLQRQYPDDEKLMTEVNLWLYRNQIEAGKYDEATRYVPALEEAKLKRWQKEMYAAATTDRYVRQGEYDQAIDAAEKLVAECRNMRRKRRFNFMLSQLYLKVNRDGEAMATLKKSTRFNFDYEMVFNAKINMALAYQTGNEGIKKKLKKMLRDPKNEEFCDRIYYAMARIEEKQGNEAGAIELYWKSVRASVDNDNQKSLSFLKLGDYYYKELDYVQAQSCYDSCMYFADSGMDGYDQLKTLLGQLTELVTNLNTIQRQDSLQRLAAMSETDRNAVIDGIIQKIKDEEQKQRDEERQAMAERNFFQRNDMYSRGNAYGQSGSQTGSGDWYFYNPMTIALGKNEFKRKWGRRKLEDNWRRQNKSMVDFNEESDLLAEGGEGGEKKADKKSRDYYLADIPLTEEMLAASNKQVADAYYRAGEIYLYTFNDPGKALECFEAFIKRFPENPNITIVYYLAYDAADKAGESSRAEVLKKELINRFPESDYAKGLQDPEYFRKVEADLKTVDKMYGEAFELYRGVYYNDALAKCDDIIRQYPENKMSSYVLFLRAMCIVNLRSADEARTALNAVTAAKPPKPMQAVVNSILASMDVGDNPVQYAEAEMYNERYLRSVRNWKFDETGSDTTDLEAKESPYEKMMEDDYCVMILLPEEAKTMQVAQLQARLAFLNATLRADGADRTEYKVGKDELWYKANVVRIDSFSDGQTAEAYMKRIAVDKTLLKNFKGAKYRIFAISKANLAVLKRLKNVEQYIDFFIANYFDDKGNGEIMVGRQGAAAHLFNYSADERHEFVIMLPYRQVNLKRVAEILYELEPTYAPQRESYDSEFDMVIIPNVGTQSQSMEFYQTASRNKELYDIISKVTYYAFTITRENLDLMRENQNKEEYMLFFERNYRQNHSGEVGVGEGNYVYSRNVPHKFVLFYRSSADVMRLKAAFEEFNFAGLTVNNVRYDAMHDCMTVSGFKDKEEAMRYFQTAAGNRKLFKSLKNEEYRNFVISETNFATMCGKKDAEAYLQFFRKYYLE